VEIALPAGAASIAPGQSVVLYDGDRVLGGGVIEASRRELPILAA
jgi:tRNA-specific 2-thiouridylase